MTKKTLELQLSDKKPYHDGEFESIKFSHRRKDYYEGLEAIFNLGYTPSDYLHHFPAFVGQMTLWKALTLYELYKKTLGLCGHIAEVGVDKGFSSLLFAKLTQIFEPESLTLVHGFDLFKKFSGEGEVKLLKESLQAEDEQRVRALVKAQQLDHVLKIHALDVAKDMDGFFAQHDHLRFRLVYLDCGLYPVVSAAIKAFWPRIVPGGLMVFDQYNHELAPGEARAVDELLPGLKVETIPNAWFPNAFVQKPFQGAR